MNNEYVVINKTELLKKMEELEKEYILISNKSDRSLSDIEDEREIIGEQRGIATIISQSTPFIPEIEKAYDEGMLFGTSTLLKRKTKQEYIKNLKLDI